MDILQQCMSQKYIDVLDIDDKDSTDVYIYI